MDPGSSSSSSKVSSLGFNEEITDILIQIGQNSDNLEEFSLRWREILPNLPVKNAQPIFNAIRHQSSPGPENQVDLDPCPSSTDCPGSDCIVKVVIGRVDSKRKGWLSLIASDRTALIKNLPIESDPRNNKFPIFGSKETIFKSWSESRAVIIYGDEARLARYLNEEEAEVSAVKRAKRESSCGVAVKNWLDDRSLLRRIHADENLSDCSAAVIDRRAATTDLLFGKFKNLLSRRSDFLLIFDSSAVFWERDKLSSFFEGCNVLDLPRDTFPVRILHLEYPICDYLYAAAFMAVQIHMKENPIGDIIVFLAGEEEIDPVLRSIIERMRLVQGDAKAPELIALPVYVHTERNDRRLLAREPSLCPPANTRRVYVTANSAEALFDFDNICFAIDCGFEKRVSENPRLATNSLEVAPISRDLAARRAGWAGRAGPEGWCYRLYTETAYTTEMGPTTAPEILRANLGEAFLRSHALDARFEFVDRPPMESMINTSRQLYCLGALGEDMRITSLGKVMAEFPVGPVYSRILVSASIDFQCSEEALTIVAMVLAGNVFERPEEEERVAEADLKRVGFFQAEGDHLTLLEVFEAWRQNIFSSQWCLDNFIQYRPMNRARELRNELASTMNRLELEIVSAEKNYTKIRMALASGLFFHAAKLDPREGCYRAVADDRRVHINSRSALFLLQPSVVVFEDLHVARDGREHMIGVTEVDPAWLLALAPRYFNDESAMWTLMSQHEKRGRGSGPEIGPCNEPKRDKRSS